MNINLEKLGYKFIRKPLLVGGMAMEYYGLRKSGKDIDFIADERDVVELIKLYPDRVKNLWYDLGVCPFEFEIWRTIGLYKYDDLNQESIEDDDYFVISLDKLLLMTVMGIEKEKYLKDTQLIVKKIINIRYNNDFNKERKIVKESISGLDNITYIEKTGPEE